MWLITTTLVALQVMTYTVIVGIFISFQLETTHYLGPVMFMVLPGLFYITVVSRLTNAAYRMTSVVETALAFGALATYCSTAIFVSSYMDHQMIKKQDIVFSVRYVSRERFVKGFLGCVSGLLGCEASRICGLVATVVMVVYIVVERPCTGTLFVLECFPLVL